jgi:hypothetical protein
MIKPKEFPERLDMEFKVRKESERVSMAHDCNSSYSGGSNQED